MSVFAAAQIASGNPPRSDVKFQIDYSTDGGQTWTPVVKDWTIPRRGEEPGDIWSQSVCSGSVDIRDKQASTVRVRFQNTGGKPCLRAEMHLVYRTKGADAAKVTFDWTDDTGGHREAHVFDASRPGDWAIKSGRNVKTRWVEFEPVAGGS